MRIYPSLIWKNILNIFKLQQAVQDVYLERVFFADLRLPPRLIERYRSIWLDDDVQLFKNVKIIKSGRHFALKSEMPQSHITVNGKDFSGFHLLQDGDLVNFRNNQTIYIYQEDPVYDWDEYNDIYYPNPKTIKVKSKFFKYINVDSKGIAFVSRKLYFPWETIRGLYFAYVQDFRRSFHFTVIYFQNQKQKSKTIKLSSKELSIVLNLIEYYAPISPSIGFSGDTVPIEDAFNIVSYQKRQILEERNQNLSDEENRSKEIILKRTKRQELIEFLYIVPLIPIPYILIYIIGKGPLTRFIIVFVVASIVYYIAMVAFNYFMKRQKS